MIPKPLQSILDRRGYLTIRDWSNATGTTRSNVLRRIQAGDIPAVDISPADSSRSQWRIYEDQARAWFESRLNRNPPAPPREEIPDFYDDDGNWIPPEQRRCHNEKSHEHRGNDARGQSVSGTKGCKDDTARHV